MTEQKIEPQENPAPTMEKPTLESIKKEFEATQEATAKKRGKSKREYKRVRFHEKSQDGQPVDIVLAIGDEVLVVRRGVETIVPQVFLEVADHAVVVGWKYNPETQANVPTRIQKYGYSLIGDATEEEYLKLKSEGTEKTKEELARSEQQGISY